MAYLGIFLDAPSRAVLLSWCEATMGAPHARVIAEHMTLQFKPSREELAAFPLGCAAALRVVGYAQDARGQAVVVASKHVDSANEIPHITISVGGGAKPVYSNKLLGMGWTPVSDGPWLCGVLRMSSGLDFTIDDAARGLLQRIDACLPDRHKAVEVALTATPQGGARGDGDAVTDAVPDPNASPLDRLRRLMTDEPPGDIDVAIGTDVVRLHRYVLTSKSAMFRDLCYPEGRPQPVNISAGDMTPGQAMQACEVLLEMYRSTAAGVPPGGTAHSLQFGSHTLSALLGRSAATILRWRVHGLVPRVLDHAREVLAGGCDAAAIAWFRSEVEPWLDTSCPSHRELIPRAALAWERLQVRGVGGDATVTDYAVVGEVLHRSVEALAAQEDWLALEGELTARVKAMAAAGEGGPPSSDDHDDDGSVWVVRFKAAMDRRAAAAADPRYVLHTRMDVVQVFSDVLRVTAGASHDPGAAAAVHALEPLCGGALLTIVRWLLTNRTNRDLGTCDREAVLRGLARLAAGDSLATPVRSAVQAAVDEASRSFPILPWMAYTGGRAEQAVAAVDALRPWLARGLAGTGGDDVAPTQKNLMTFVEHTLGYLAESGAGTEASARLGDVVGGFLNDEATGAAAAQCMREVLLRRDAKEVGHVLATLDAAGVALSAEFLKPVIQELPH